MSYRDVVLNDTPIRYWRLEDDVDPLEIYDETQSGVSAFPIGGQFRVPGKVDYGWQGDGIDDHLELDTIDEYEELSFEIWVSASSVIVV